VTGRISITIARCAIEARAITTPEHCRIGANLKVRREIGRFKIEPEQKLDAIESAAIIRSSPQKQGQ
jgi:hypothetical protein